MRLAKICGGILCLCVALAGASGAYAQEGIFLETVGPAILGESTVPGYVNQIEVTSGQFGVSSPPCVPGALNVSEFVFSKDTDRASVDLLSAAQSGTVFTEFNFRFVRDDPVAGTVNYQTYSFKSAAVSSFSSAGGGSGTAESISITFSQVDIEYVYVDSKGGLTPETMTLTAPACPGS